MKRLSSEKYLLDINGFLYLFWPMIENVDAHMHEYYEFFFIKSGSVIHTINGKVQILPPNSLCLVRPNDYHAYQKVTDEPFSMYNAMLTSACIQTLFNYMGDNSYLSQFQQAAVPPVIQLSQEESDSLVQNIHYLLSLNQRTPDAHAVNRLILSHVVYKLMLSDSSIHFSQLPSWLSQSIAQMQEKKNFVEGLPALLQISGKSHEFVCRTFQKYFHCSPSEYINRLRIKHAEFLLLNTSYPVVDIALECGFNSISHFNHVFKQELTCSPSDYRRLNKNVVLDSYEDPRVMPQGAQNI